MLNGKKKVSFSMLLDRISCVILCADEAKSIYRILCTHLTLLGYTRVKQGRSTFPYSYRFTFINVQRIIVLRYHMLAMGLVETLNKEHIFARKKFHNWVVSFASH